MLLKLKLISKIFTFAEFYTILMSIFYILLTLILWEKLDNPFGVMFVNLSLILGISFISLFSYPMIENRNILLLKKVYIAPLLWVVYSQVHTFIPVVNPNDYDNLLINLDRMIFGIDITTVLFKIANPILTEFLQFCYMLHFFLPIFIGVELVATNRRETLSEYTNFIVFGFYFSYLLYFFLPAIGPRFTLHNFETINQELPGLWLTNFFRDAVNAGGAIPKGASHPAELANRDCMPSGHTMIAFMNIILANRYKIKNRMLVTFLASGLIFSTLYMRYHYLIDVVAGIACALIALWLEPKIRGIILKHKFKFM